MENVKGLLSARYKNESIFQHILSDLKRPGSERWAGAAPRGPLEYHLMPLAAGSAEILASLRQAQPRDFVLKAEDYGIPQARHRIIILGVRADLRWTPAPL